MHMNLKMANGFSEWMRQDIKEFYFWTSSFRLLMGFFLYPLQQTALLLLYPPKE